MGFTYQIIPELKLVKVQWQGPFNLEQMNTSIQNLYDDKNYSPDLRGFCDAREADFQLSHEEVIENHKFTVNHPMCPTGPWAVLCEEPMQTAYAMMYETIAKPPHPIQVFCTEESAMEWLDKQL